MRQESMTAPAIKNSTDLNLVSSIELSKHLQDVIDSIARRAYEHSESRGHLSGNDWTDWFLAESELLKPVKLYVVESSDHLIAHAEVPGFGPHEIKVSIEPRFLKICARREASEDGNTGEAIMRSFGRPFGVPSRSFMWSPQSLRCFPVARSQMLLSSTVHEGPRRRQVRYGLIISEWKYDSKWRRNRCPKHLNAVITLNGIQKLGEFAASLSKRLFLIYGSKPMCTTLRETNLNTSSKVTRPTMWLSTKGER